LDRQRAVGVERDCLVDLLDGPGPGAGSHEEREGESCREAAYLHRNLRLIEIRSSAAAGSGRIAPFGGEMKRFLKLLGLAVLAILAVAGIGVAYLTLRRPALRPPPAVTVERTPERLARGEYLVRHVSVCMECHAEHVRGRYANPLVPGAAVSGQLLFTKDDGFPGVLAAQNLTPDAETGLGLWSDGEVLRA